MTSFNVEVNTDGNLAASNDRELNSALEQLDSYVTQFRIYDQKIDAIPWIFKTILFPIGFLIEGYWLRKMQALNREFGQKLD